MQEQGFYNENKIEHLNVKMSKRDINETMMIVLEIIHFNGITK